MLSFLKKFFGAKTVEVIPTPYKVEAPVLEATPVSVPTVKKAVKKVTTRKPRTPKA